MKKVGIYCRKSQVTVNDRSIEDQKLHGIEYCETNNYDYIVYIDDGVSGTIDERPGFKNLLSDIIEGNINIVWVFDDSRIQRNPEIRHLFNNTLQKNGVEYHTHLEGRVDFTNPETNLFGGIMAEFNQYFVTITKLKIKSVLKRRALKGKGWGIPPYGFTYDENGFYLLDKEESRVVKQIYALSLSGWGTERIAKKLNEDNVPTRYNKYDGEIKLHKRSTTKLTKSVRKKDIKWVGNSVRGIIKNPMFFGKKTIGDLTIDIPNPLFSIEYWEEVNHNLKSKNRNTKNPGGKKKYQYLINNLIKCGRCGRNFNGKTRSDKKDHFYYCMSKRYKEQNCGNRSINIDKIENFIWNILFEPRTIELIKEEVGNLGRKKEYENELLLLEKEIKQLNLEKNNILDIVGKGKVSFDEVEDKINEIRVSLNEVNQKKIDTLERYKNIRSLDLSDLEKGSKFFLDMEFEKRQILIEKFIKSIKVHWVEETIDSKKVKYYILIIEFKVNNIKRIFTNDVNMNLDVWLEYRLHYSQENKTQTLSFLTTDMVSGKFYPLLTIEYYKKYLADTFQLYSNELTHKLNNEIVKKYLFQNAIFNKLD
jgi:site-specific DNA recombinase